MNVVLEMNSFALQVMGYQQKTEGITYRFNKFCLTKEHEDGVLMYNALTGALVNFTELEYEMLDPNRDYDYIEFLVSNWFLVPEEYDEEVILKIIRDRKSNPLVSTYLDHPSFFTILTTSACNARCFYCYELGIKKKVHMSMETAEKVANYIIKSRYKYTDNITLDWFGGEPLFNSQVIDLICFRVTAAGIHFNSSMVTNGYLFDDATIKKAINQWNLTNVQITLDGTEEVYNKTKAYIYKNDESPFKRVISNIHKLLDQNIKVNIRLNCDKHNFKDLLNLVDYLHNEFGNNPNFAVYAWQVFEEGFTRTDEEHKALYESLIKIEQRINNLFGGVVAGINKEVSGVHCMVDRGNAVCVYPKGEIGVCEHYLEDHFVSHVDNPTKKNWEILKQWRQFTPFGEICKDCPIRPECLRVKGCTDEKLCEVHQKSYKIFKAQMGMLKEWKDYLERLQNNNNQGCSCKVPNCPQHDPCYNSKN
jgi:radical SAM protein with 4Fe4S-binding SPASM domain